MAKITYVDSQAPDSVKESYAYTYDKNSNILTETIKNHSLAAENQQTDITRTHTYDALGQLLTTTDVDAIRKVTTGTSYEYDIANRLSKVTQTADGTIRLIQTSQYDGNGQRVEKAENGEVTSYLYQNQSVLGTKNGNGGMTTFNILGADNQPVATSRYSGTYAGKTYFYQKDIKGSTTSLTDEAGTGIITYEYDAFGETVKKGDASFTNEICYTGAIYDESTGLYYLNARYYDPENGRFLTQDTYRGEKDNYGTWHLYVYCANNPVNYTDPSGRSARVASAIAGEIMGVGVDLAIRSFIHFVCNKGKLNNFKYTVKDFTKAALSGLVDGILVSSRLRRNAMAVASGAKAAILTYIENRNSSIKTVAIKVISASVSAAVVSYLAKSKGVGTEYWNRGLFRKGSYSYGNVTVRYGLKVKMSSKSLRARKDVMKKCVESMISGHISDIVSSGTKKVIKSTKKWLKK